MIFEFSVYYTPAGFEFNDLGMHHLQWSRHTLCCRWKYIYAQKYIEIIDNHLWSVVAAHFPSNDYLFQDENVPVHKARSVKEFMEQENIMTMQCLAQSPDLNIIENCWRKLK